MAEKTLSSFTTGSRGVPRSLAGNGHVVLGYISGKMRMSCIRILPGEQVMMKPASFDQSRAHIVFRAK
ncbi:hypothetical protein BI347_09365 [Chromobacterium sphagni]|uniref:S1-like domain-containing protein n=1 Tax=Chromobacterium sphagni TaxID=1903179 RepID=A0A1S1X2M5_9NEIS|nr:hypothetical protein BI347_09365 [Chromobacterium sphagni]